MVSSILRNHYFLFELELYKFSIVAFCAFLLGVSKSGIKGIAALIVTGFALVYGAKTSTGVLMPLLLVGDVFAITYYKPHVQWKYIVKLMPWMVLGVLAGVVGGSYISDDLFKYGMGGIILFSVGQMYYWENKKDKNRSHSLELWNYNGPSRWVYHHGRKFGGRFFKYLFSSHASA